MRISVSAANEPLLQRIMDLHSEREHLRAVLRAVELAVAGVGGDSGGPLAAHDARLVAAAPPELRRAGRAICACVCDPILGRPLPGVLCPRHPEGH